MAKERSWEACLLSTGLGAYPGAWDGRECDSSPSTRAPCQMGDVIFYPLLLLLLNQ